MDLSGDRGDIVLGWLTKLTVALAVVGLVGFDAVALGATRFQAEDHAQTAARVAVESWATDKNLQKAYDAALAAVAADGTLYVLDSGNFRVQAFDREGTFLRAFGKAGVNTGNFARPRGIAVDDEGRIYVSDASFNNFQIFQPIPTQNPSNTRTHRHCRRFLNVVCPRSV